MAGDNKTTATTATTVSVDEEFNIQRLKRIHVEATIRELGIERAWRPLGVSRCTIYRWVREWKKADRRAAAAQAREAKERETASRSDD